MVVVVGMYAVQAPESVMSSRKLGMQGAAHPGFNLPQTFT